MERARVLAITILLTSALQGQVPDIWINEVVADNTASNPYTIRIGQDEEPRYTDWVEIYNPTAAPVNIKGLYLSDTPLVPGQWEIGSVLEGSSEDVIVPARGFLTLWCDGQPHAPTADPPISIATPGRHAPFRLSRTGESIGIYMKMGEDNFLLIDGFTFPFVPEDVAWGRSPDGGSGLGYILDPTPAASNGPLDENPPPDVNVTRYRAVRLVGGTVEDRGLIPGDADQVNVRAEVSDEKKDAPNGGVATVTAYYVVDDGPVQTVPMLDDGKHDDKELGDGVYGGFIPPQPLGAVVEFWVGATDEGGDSSFDPPDASASSGGATPFRYGVGGSPRRGQLFLNEALARNIVGIRDNWGEAEDWVEILSATDGISLDGMYLTNNELDLTKWQIPELAPLLFQGDHYVIWCDGEGPGEDGEYLGLIHIHASYRLNRGGDRLILVDRDGAAIIDTIEFGQQEDDISFGRSPDASEKMGKMTPSPRQANGLILPDLVVLSYSPLKPSAGQDVLILARAASEAGVTRVTIYHSSNPPSFEAVEMKDDGLSGDGDPGDGIYGGLVPGYPASVLVQFWVEVEDGQGIVVKDPRKAEESPWARSTRYLYTVGVEGDVALNEVVAANLTTLLDEEGDPDDWIELYNKTASPVTLDGMYLTDDPLRNRVKWRIPDYTTVPGNGYIVFFCDAEPDEGLRHTNFRLDAAGDEIALINTDGISIVDALAFGPLRQDAALARIPDGSAAVELTCSTTPGLENRLEECPPDCTVEFMRGDLDGDVKVGLTDAILLLSRLFLPVGSRPVIHCEKAGDFDDNGSLELADVIRLLIFIFGKGPPPAQPFPQPGCDTTEDPLPCGP